MDLYYPEPESAPIRRAAILWIHGGGWWQGDKAQFGPTAAWFCERGYVCASMKYRLSQKATFPAALEDARLAMQFLRARAAELGIDSNRIAAAGSSAGGYLAAMLAMLGPKENLGRAEELSFLDTRPNAAVLYCPVTTLHRERATIHRFMGCEEREAPDLYRTASPIDRIQGGEPPMLLLQGDEDHLTPLSEVAEFVQRLREVGTIAELEVLPGVGHGFGYGVHTEAQRKSCEVALRFLKQILDDKDR
jgi:acetyl esterase/lipase